MALEIGSIVEGVVTGIAKFGAFIELPDKKVGLVHISEVANEYVNDVNDYLKVQDRVQVKIISIDEKGKIALSIKQTQAPAPREKSLKDPGMTVLNPAENVSGRTGALRTAIRKHARREIFGLCAGMCLRCPLRISSVVF